MRLIRWSHLYLCWLSNYLGKCQFEYIDVDYFDNVDNVDMNIDSTKNLMDFTQTIHVVEEVHHNSSSLVFSTHVSCGVINFSINKLSRFENPFSHSHKSLSYFCGTRNYLISSAYHSNPHRYYHIWT